MIKGLQQQKLILPGRVFAQQGLQLQALQYSQLHGLTYVWFPEEDYLGLFAAKQVSIAKYIDLLANARTGLDK